MGASGGRDRSVFPAQGGQQGARRPDRIPWSPHVILSRADGSGSHRAAHGAGSGTEPERPARPGCPARAAARRPSSWRSVGPAARGQAWRASLEAHSTTSSRPGGGLVHSIAAVLVAFRRDLVSRTLAPATISAYTTESSRFYASSFCLLRTAYFCLLRTAYFCLLRTAYYHC
jgi:hypothetical protein